MKEIFFEIDTENDSIENIAFNFIKNHTHEDEIMQIDEFMNSAFTVMDEKRRESFMTFCKNFHEFKIDFDNRCK
jgi:hypothetical protein